MTSLIMNCNHYETQQNMLDVVSGWNDDASKETVSIVTPEAVESQSCSYSNSDNSFHGRQNSSFHFDETDDEIDHSNTTCNERLSQEEISRIVQARFRAVIKSVDERKIEQSKKAKAASAHKKKKKALQQSDVESDGSYCGSIADLDAFVSAEGRSSEEGNLNKNHRRISLEEDESEEESCCNDSAADLDRFVAAENRLSTNRNTSSEFRLDIKSKKEVEESAGSDDFTDDDDWW